MKGMMEAACGFPGLFRFSAATEAGVRAAFGRAAIKCGNANGYLSLSLLSSLAAAALAGALWQLLFSDALLSAGVSLLSLGIVFLFALRLPQMLALRREALMEMELPYLLRELAIYIDIGVPFEACIAKLAKSDYEISQEMAALGREISSGASPQAAFSRLSASTGSLAIKRSLQLAAMVHTDLAHKFIGAVDCRKRLRVGAEHALENGDIIKIIAGR